MSMNHICTASISSFNIHDCYTCGMCNKAFNTICMLHLHLTRHSSGGSYHYDNTLKVAFPKYDTTCKSTQTNGAPRNYIVETRYTRKKGCLEDERKWVNNVTPTFKDKDKKTHVTLLCKDAKTLRNEQRVNKNRSDSIFTSTSSARSTEKQRLKECSLNELKHTKSDSNVDTKERNWCDKNMKIDMNSNERQSHNSPNEFDIDVSDPFYEEDIDDDNNEDAKDNDSIVSNNVDIDVIEGTSNNMFRVPETVPFKRKKEQANSLSEVGQEGERLSKKLHLSMQKKKKRSLAGDIHFQNSETSMSDNDEHDCENNDIVNDIDNETDNLEENYFFGKIISTSFIIERHKSDEIISKGERKADSYQVFVDGTWYPDNEEQNGSFISEDKSPSDDFEISKVKELYGMDPGTDIAKGEYLSLKKKWKNEQKCKFKCDQCGKTFKHQRYFEGHMNFHAGVTPYMCQYCGKTYTNRTSLQMHEKLLHSDKSLWFTCSICKGSFATPAHLRAHELSHSNDYSHICDICNKSYKNGNLLKRHQAYAHSNKQYRCRNCRQSFDTVEDREEHQSKKHNSKEIKCRTCGRQFTSERSKVRHEKIHKGIKPHECHICLRRFLQKTPFWVHMEKHHDLTKADLVRLFPEKHLDRNHQHLIKEMDINDNVERKDDDVNDDNYDDDNDDNFVDNDLLLDSPAN